MPNRTLQGHFICKNQESEGLAFFKIFSHFRHPLGDMDMLRTDTLTGVAGNAGSGLAMALVEVVLVIFNLR